MPTSLQTKARRKLDFFIIFAIMLGMAVFAVETMGPARVDAETAAIAGP